MKGITTISLVLVVLLTVCIAPAAVEAHELTPSEQAYMRIRINHLTRANESFYELSELMANPRRGDDKWTLAVAVQLAAIYVLYVDAMEIDPPASMAHIHYKHVQAMSHYKTFAHLLAQGLDKSDVNLINRAKAELDAGGQRIKESRNLLYEFKETRQPKNEARQPITPSEQAYLGIMIDHFTRASEAFDELSELIANPRRGDDKWTLAVAVQLAAIYVLYVDAMEIDPPASMAHIHYKHVQAMSHYKRSAHLIARGLDKSDVNLINQAKAELDAGYQRTKESGNLLHEFREARQPKNEARQPKNEEDKGCFIATAAYGTDTTKEIDILREFRDEVLLPDSLGALFVSFYYRTSPLISDFISQHDILRTIVREGFVDPIVAILEWSHSLWSE